MATQILPPEDPIGGVIVIANAAGSTLEGTSENDILVSNTGDDLLIGNDGNDELIAGIGRDTLVGGLGFDTFRIALEVAPTNAFGEPIIDNTVIADFEPGFDAPIALIFPTVSAPVPGIFSSFEELLAASVEQDGSVVITLTPSHTLTLEGLSLDDLSERHFLGSIEDLRVPEFQFEFVPDVVRNSIGDRIFGGDGQDVVFAEFGFSNDRVFADAGDDIVFSGGGDDQVFGNLGNDFISGESGDDILFGGAGRDTLQGGSGNDELFGGAGNDLLTGGTGKDTFYFNATGGRDAITDFNVQDDTLFLANTVTDFTDLQSVLDAARVSQGFTDGPAVTIDLGGGNSLLLNDVTLEDLSSINFIF